MNGVSMRPTAPAPIHTVTELPGQITQQLRSPGGWLEDPVTAGVVLTLAVLVAAGWAALAWRWHRHGTRPRHPVPRRAGLSLVVLVLALVGGLLAVNSYAGYVPSLGALGELLTGSSSVGDAPKGTFVTHLDTKVPLGASYRHPARVTTVTIGAPALGVPALRTYVYLPAGYDDPANAKVRYPVVYLIHGYPGKSSDWLRAGSADQAMNLLTARRLVHPMIIVMPDANGGWLHDSECLNAVHGQQLETYLSQTVVATIDHAFRTRADRRYRAIGGMSSGAYCALNLGLHHLDTYSVILASEPYGTPGQRALDDLLAHDQALYEKNSPAAYLPRLAFTHPVAVFLDAGSDDRYTTSAANELARLLAARSQYVALRSAPGLGHTWREARAELPYSLVFADQHFGATGGAAAPYRRSRPTPVRARSGRRGTRTRAHSTGARSPAPGPAVPAGGPSPG